MLGIQLSNFGFKEFGSVDLEVPRMASGDLLVRVRAAAINYRDIEIIEGRYAMPVPLPLVPLSDAVGEVVELGEGVTRFSIGDRVNTVFFPNWQAGDFRNEYFQHQLGSSVRGVLQQFIAVPEAAVVHAPKHLGDEAAALPIAAVTAWNVLRDANLYPGQTVLIIGTGGVALFALQFAQLHGANTIVVTSDRRKIEKVQALGGGTVLDSNQDHEWGQRVMDITAGRGVDVVVEVGGSKTLAQSSRALRVGGYLAIVGYLSGSQASIDLRALFIAKRARVQGHTVGSRASFEEMNRAIELHRLKPVVDSTFPIGHAVAAFDRARSGEAFGKVLITL
jgi:NADPH:quinone reductase-like Zn-dependent oxidoreductase